jgi:hypothetical protein
MEDGEKIHDFEAAEKAEVFHAGVQPLQNMRKAARHSSQIRRLPHMLSGSRVQRPDSWRQEG